jgi:hypothetical protein
VSVPRKILMWAVIAFLALVLLRTPALAAKLGHGVPHAISAAASSFGAFLGAL